MPLPPGLHPPMLRALGFERATVPALKVDGERIQGSIEICRYLEVRVSGRPLYPTDSSSRKRSQQAEEWAENTLQPLPRRMFRWSATRSQQVRRFIAAEALPLPFPGIGGALSLPAAYLLARKVGADSDRVKADLAELPVHLDRIDELIADGVIGGEPGAADFQIATTVNSLLGFQELIPLIEDRPAGQLAREVDREMPGPLPPCLPAEWVPAG